MHRAHAVRQFKVTKSSGIESGVGDDRRRQATTGTTGSALDAAKNHPNVRCSGSKACIKPPFHLFFLFHFPCVWSYSWSLVILHASAGFSRFVALVDRQLGGFRLPSGKAASSAQRVEQATPFVGERGGRATGFLADVLARFWRALIGLHLVSLPCSVFLELFGCLDQICISARRSLALVVHGPTTLLVNHCRSAFEGRARVAGPAKPLRISF